MECVIFVERKPHAEFRDEEAIVVKGAISFEAMRKGYAELLRNYPSIDIAQRDPSLYSPSNLRDLDTKEPLDIRGRVLREKRTHYCLVDIEQVAQPQVPPLSTNEPSKRRRKAKVSGKKQNQGKRRQRKNSLTSVTDPMSFDSSDDNFYGKYFDFDFLCIFSNFQVIFKNMLQ